MKIQKIGIFNLLILISLSLSLAFILLNQTYSGNEQVSILINRLPDQESKYQHTEMDPELTRLVNLINERNRKMKTFVCDNISIRIQNRSLLRLSGELFYQKEKKFKMVIKSFAGHEVDIGSNEKQFWFWSKRMDPPAVYYSDHENLLKTGLKTPFHPMWIKATLGFDLVDTSNSLARKRGDFWEIVQIVKGVRGNNVTKITLIESTKGLVVGHYIFEKGSIVASSEVIEWSEINGFFIPVNVRIKWHIEDIEMSWTFLNGKINSAIDYQKWVMPSHDLQIDMANQK